MSINTITEAIQRLTKVERRFSFRDPEAIADKWQPMWRDVEEVLDFLKRLEADRCAPRISYSDGIQLFDIIPGLKDHFKPASDCSDFIYAAQPQKPGD